VTMTVLVLAVVSMGFGVYNAVDNVVGKQQVVDSRGRFMHKC
jgi:hypothetical protein